MKKRILGFLVTIIVFSMIAAPVSVYSKSFDTYFIGIEPFWQNTSQIILSLSFSNGTATASGTIIGKSDASSISATYSLQEKVGNSWVTVHTWASQSTSGRTLGFSGTASATSGKTYRLTVSGSVTNTAGSVESVAGNTERKY